MSAGKASVMILVIAVAALAPVFQPATASRYRDNLDWLIDRRASPQFMPIGELESVETFRDDRGNTVRRYGTAVLISPCYIITNHHVVFGSDPDPIQGKDYSMKFRVGVSSNSDTAFLGNTIANPALWGYLGPLNRDDWAIMKLQTCVGSRADIGWMEFSSLPTNELKGRDVAVVGYSGASDRGQLSFSLGRAHHVEPLNGLMSNSASSSAGQSGGAVLTRENDIIKIAGIETSETLGGNMQRRLRQGNNLFDTFIDSVDEFGKRNKNSNENLFLPLAAILNRPDISEMLLHDRIARGPNPALRYMAMPWPGRPLQIPSR